MHRTLLQWQLIRYVDSEVVVELPDSIEEIEDMELIDDRRDLLSLRTCF